MAGSTSKRVPGHELRYEGAAFNALGKADWGTTGRGKCSCGALSPDLPSNNQRKAWHREHKAAVLESRGEA